MPRAFELRLAFAWIDRNRSAASRLAIVGPLFERDEHVGAARQHHLDAGLLQQQLLEPQRDVEHEVGFGQVLSPRARDHARRGRDR